MVEGSARSMGLEVEVTARQLGTAARKPARGDREKRYPLVEAVKMSGTRECEVRRNIESCDQSRALTRHADQMSAGVVTLPNVPAPSLRAVYSRAGAKAMRPRLRALTLVARRRPRREGRAPRYDFDPLGIATPDMMPLVGRLGKVLGPTAA